MVPDDIAYGVTYRPIKYPRLEFKTGQLHLILPYKYKPADVIERHRTWIIGKTKFIQTCLRNSKDKRIVNRTDEIFKTLIYDRTHHIATQLRVKINRIYFRRMRTKWASCSAKRNVTVNTLMKNLPNYLIEYILYHELLHLLEKKHNEKFRKLLSKRYKNYQKIEISLFNNWFLVNSLLPQKSS